MRDFLLRCSRFVFNWPPAPASFLEKHNLITRIAKNFDLKNFVETGTFRGGMIETQLPHFTRLFSIELNEEFFAAAQKKFAGQPQIQLIQGDSGVKLAEVSRSLDEPALFWLDAHYSRGKTSGAGVEAPIIKELSCLSSRQFADAILIDDARLFGLKSDYPKLRVIREFAQKTWPQHNFAIESDIICILPPT